MHAELVLRTLIERAEEYLRQVLIGKLDSLALIGEPYEHDASIVRRSRTLDIALLLHLAENLVEGGDANAHDSCHILGAHAILLLEEGKDATATTRRVAKRACLTGVFIANGFRHLTNQHVLVKKFVLAAHCLLRLHMVPVNHTYKVYGGCIKCQARRRVLSR